MNKPIKKRKRPISPERPADAPGIPHSNGHHVVVNHRVENYSGPIPHPAILERFNVIIPNGAERIMAMVEEEQLHRQGLEKEMVLQDGKEAVSGRKAERRGQFLAAVICLSLIFVAREVALSGHPGYATLLAGGTLAGIITAFVSGNFRGAAPSQPAPKQDEE